MTYRPERAILDLGDAFYDPVKAADFPQAILRFRNDRAAAEIGIAYDDAEWVRHFGRFEPLPGSLEQPLALRYHGHQFRVYNPDIGDGRGFLFAQLRDQHDRLMDLGTKGSGQTPWSRFGDGRLTLKGGMREILATEMLEALGAGTSRTFSLIETGEALQRGDEPSPTRSAVMVRLSHGHIRIGTFQRLAYLDEPDNLRKLVAYCLRHYYGEEVGEDAQAPLRLLRHVTARTARMAASFITAGFVHGVLNSDNINITGESFDYGPWRWTPYWDGGFTAAYFDQNGLYAFGRQPEAIYWDVAQLAISLSGIADPEAMSDILQAFPGIVERALRDTMFARLGIATGVEEDDMQILLALQAALATQTVTIDRFFFDWRGGRARNANPAYDAEPFVELAAKLEGATALPGALDHPYWSDSAPCAMHIDEVEALWSHIDTADDWAPLHAKIAAIRRMGDAYAGRSISAVP